MVVFRRICEGRSDCALRCGDSSPLHTPTVRYDDRFGRGAIDFADSSSQAPQNDMVEGMNDRIGGGMTDLGVVHWGAEILHPL
jgi:hypothetical protein